MQEIGTTGAWEDCVRLDQALSMSALAFPTRPALSGGERTLTYAELEQAVTTLAGELAALGLTAGRRVGVRMPKSVEAVIAIYAALRLGAVVAPLDVTDPPERAARMLRGAGIEYLLTRRRDLAGALRLAKLRMGAADAASAVELPEGMALISLDGPQRAPVDGESGYVLFTSGSTGWPKGVMLSHANVLYFAKWAAKMAGLSWADRVGSQASLTFDLSTFDLFSSALAGACVCLLPDALRAFPLDVAAWLDEREISVLYAVPTMYQALLLQGGIEERRPRALRLAMYAGEPFPPQLLKRYLRAFPELAFCNLYGPTETNVCTFEYVLIDKLDGVAPSIGRALEGVEVEVIGADGSAAEFGELFVAGPTVFQGYLIDGRLSDARRSVRFRDGVERLAYGTGDIVQRGEDGRFYLQGRRDHQVKRRGHRIDLLDIESVVLALPGIENAAVVGKSGAADGMEIWAYVVAPAQAREALRLALAAALPQRMLPDHILMRASLPLTPNGKIDRRALGAHKPQLEE